MTLISTFPQPRRSTSGIRFLALAALAAAMLVLGMFSAVAFAAPIEIRSGVQAGGHGNLSIAVSGDTLKLKRVRRLNVDFPEGLNVNTGVGASRCAPISYLRNRCDGVLTVGKVTIKVARGGRRFELSGPLRLLRTGRGMIATYGVTLNLPRGLGMDERAMRLTDRVRLRASDNGINHSFGDLYRDLSGYGLRIESLTVSFKGKVGKGRKAEHLITNPARCDVASFRVSATTWAGHFAPITHSRVYKGCDAVPFNPRVEFGVDNATRRSGTGFTFAFGVPLDGAAIGSAHLRKAVAKMQFGSAWNSSFLDGISICTADSFAKRRCAKQSKLGAVSAELSATAFKGDVFLTERAGNVWRFKALLRSAENAQFIAHGSLTVEGATGSEHPVLTVDDTAQLPLMARFSFVSPLLINSRICGDNLVSTAFTSYGNASATRTNPYSVSGCPGAPAAPRITSGPGDQAFVSSDEVEFAFDSADLLPDDPTTFECSANGAAFDECSSPFTATDLPDDTYSFAVRAIRDGKSSAAVARIFVVDTMAPIVSIDAPDDGLFTGDGTPTVVFTASDANPQSTDCQMDAAPSVACDANFTSTVSDGGHTVKVRATDKAGNVGEEAVSFTVDTAAPVVTANVETPTPGFTKIVSPTVSHSVTDLNEDFTLCKVDSGSYAACGTSIGPLLEGAHTYSVRHIDKAGNAGVGVVDFTVDTTDPEISIDTPVVNTYTADVTPQVDFTTVDDNLGSDECSVDLGAFSACSPGDELDALGDGSHTLRIRHTDAAGNDRTASRSFTIDTVAPVPVINSPVDESFVSASSFAYAVTDANLSASSTCTIDGVAVACVNVGARSVTSQGLHVVEVRHTDLAGNSASAAISYTRDSITPAATIVSPLHGAYTASDTVTYSITDANLLPESVCTIDGAATSCANSGTLTVSGDGSHTVNIKHTDKAGNLGFRTNIFVLDKTPPGVNLASPVDDAFVRDATPPLTFTVTDANPQTTQCKIDDGPFVACSSGTDLAFVSDGTHTLTVRHTDKAGNAGERVLSYHVDTQLPVMNGVEPVDGSVTGDNTPAVAFSISEDNPGVTQCSVNGFAYFDCDSGDEIGPLDDGPVSLAVRHTDAAGNSHTAVADFTVDTAKPSLTLSSPADSAYYDADPVPVAFGVTDASAHSEDCAIDSDPFAACPPDLDLPDGVHTLTLRSTDAATNQQTLTNTFTVDSVAPQVTIDSPQHNHLYNTNTIARTVTLDETNPGTTTCQIDAVTTTCDNALDAEDGPHTFTASHTDAAGNSHTAVADFTVDTDMNP